MSNHLERICLAAVALTACSVELASTSATNVRCASAADCPNGDSCLATGWCASPSSACVTLSDGVLIAIADGGPCTLSGGGPGVCASGLCMSCGDGVHTLPEACDDGNSSNEDRCLTNCQLNVCGDGFVAAGVEPCDDGNAINDDACLVGCVVNVCGDGFVDPAHEDCDDGDNDNPNDGCDHCHFTSWSATQVVGLGPTPSDAQNQRVAGNHVAVDGRGNVYIATARQVMRWDSTTHVLIPYVGDAATPATLGETIPTNTPARFARLHEITAIAVSPDGRLYLAESVRLNVYAITEKGTLQLVAGNGVQCVGAAACGMGGFATAASFSSFINAIAFDGRGNLYIRDWYRIYRVDHQTGLISRLAGSTLGCSSCGDGGAAADATITLEGDIAVDSVGNIILSDHLAGGWRIRRIDAASATVSAFAGNGTTCVGTCGDGLPAASATFNTIAALAFDPNDDLLVSDSTAGRVRRVTPARVDTIVGSSTKCASSDAPCGDGGPATSALLGAPHSLAVDSSGHIYMLDVLSASSSRLRRVADGVITTIVGDGIRPDPLVTGALGTSEDVPVSAMAVAPNGDIVFSTDSRIARLRASDATVELVAGSRDGCTVRSDPCGDGGPATAARFGSISQLWVAPDDAIWILDNTYRVRIIRNGVVTTVAGSGGNCSTVADCNGATPTTAALGQPIRFVVYPAATGDVLYVLDYRFSVVRRSVLPSGPFTTYAGTGALPYNGDSGSAASLNLGCPTDIAVDAADTLYIAETGNCRVLGVTAGVASFYGPASLTRCEIDEELEEPCNFVDDGGFRPQNITWDGSSLVTSIPERRLVRLTSTAISSAIVDSGASGFLIGDGGPALEATVSSFGSLTAAGGRIVFIDAARPRYAASSASIREIDGSGTIRTLLADVDNGTMGPLTLARLSEPSAMAVIDSGRVAITDGRLGRIRVMDLVANRMETVAGYGDGLVIDGGARAARYAQLGDIQGLAYDAPSQRLFAADASAHAVYEMRLVNSAWTIRRIAGGARGFADGPGTSAKLDTPHGLAIDSAARRLWVADRNNHALRAIAIDDTAFAVTTPIGQAQRPGFAGDGGPATLARLDSPSAVVVTPGGVCFSDTFNDRVRCVDDAGVVTTVGRAADDLIEPMGVSYDAFGNLLVTSRGKIAARPYPAAGPWLPLYGDDTSGFPASIMRCSREALPVDDVIWVSDACQGLAVRLSRATP